MEHDLPRSPLGSTSRKITTVTSAKGKKLKNKHPNVFV
jgi:hypothetical protein